MDVGEARAHYPSVGARIADLCVHLAGLGLALFGAGLLLGLAFTHDSAGRIAAVAIYAAGVLAMLGLSTAYNFARPAWQPLLRRFDQAGVFLMIAGSYTPFTTQVLKGAWSLSMTGAVWAVAIAGMVVKLAWPRSDRRVFIVAYLALGWLGVVALKPLVSGLSWVTLMLLVTGGAIYSTGVAFYLARRLRFRRAIWHGHVVAAAIAHWVAVLLGVVLAGASA
jgi:hemolysin III